MKCVPFLDIKCNFHSLRHVKYYSGPGSEEDYAIYVLKTMHYDGTIQASLRMTNLRNNYTSDLFTLQGEV